MYLFVPFDSFRYCSPTPGIKEEKKREERNGETYFYCIVLFAYVLTAMMNRGIREARGEKNLGEVGELN